MFFITYKLHRTNPHTFRHILNNNIPTINITKINKTNIINLRRQTQPVSSISDNRTQTITTNNQTPQINQIQQSFQHKTIKLSQRRRKILPIRHLPIKLNQQIKSTLLISSRGKNIIQTRLKSVHRQQIQNNILISKNHKTPP